MSWIHEHGRAYEVPGFIEFLVEKKIIEDLSWHNDVSPSFGVSDDRTEKLVRLWVDHPFKDHRETQGTRFAVTVEEEASQEDFFDYDDLDPALEKLFTLAAEVKLGRVPGVLEWRPETHVESEWEDPMYYLSELKKEYLRRPGN